MHNGTTMKGEEVTNRLSKRKENWFFLQRYDDSDKLDSNIIP